MESSNKWSSLKVQTRIAYITALVAFFLGWGLTIAGFIIGAGVISDSVLWVLGQALVYTASVFGVGLYVTSEVKHMRQSIRSFMNAEDRKLNEHFEDEANSDAIYGENNDEIIEEDE